MDPRQLKDVELAHYRASATSLRRERTIEDKAVVLPSQRGIDHGSVWVRFIPNERGCAWGYSRDHFHWGRVLTVREYALGRLNAGDSPEEIEDNVGSLRMRHDRGWRLSSVHCDAGGLMELVSLPVSGLWPCRTVEYAMARTYHFDGNRMREDRWFAGMWRRYKEQTRKEAREAGLYQTEDPVFTLVDEEEQK